MSRRRHEVGGSKRTPPRPKPGRGPVRRRRRSMMWRASTRGATLAFLGAAVVAVAGVAIAGALTSGGSSAVKPDAAATPPAGSTGKPSPSATLGGPVAPTPAATHASRPKPAPTVTSTPKPVATATHAVATATPKSTASQTAHSSCPPASQRVQAAGRLLQHRDALPRVTLITAGPRQGLLGDSDAQARTLTLYVRSCADEPTLELASVWGYEAGQFIPVQQWSSAKQSKWEQLRGSGSLSYNELKQDAASVYAFWQTGTTRYWQSPVSPPSYSQLSKLVPFLTTS